MIKKEKIKVKTNKKTEKWFLNKGYVFKRGDIIEIYSNELNKGSHIKVNVVCDICDKEKKLSYQKYIKNINNGGYYTCCPKCAQEKVKKTTIEKYGKEYYTQCDEYKKRYKETCLEKYGHEHHTQNIEVKEKIKETCLEKYGTTNYLISEDGKTKIKEYLDKNNITNVFQLESVKNKIKQTCLEKFGETHFMKTDLSKNLIKNINLEKYDVENYTQSIEFKEKYKKWSLEKYGVENPFQSEIIKEKIKQVNLLKSDEEKEKIQNKRIKSYKKAILDRYSLKKLNVKNIIDNNITLLCKTCNKEYTIDLGLLYNRLRYNTILCTHCNPIDKNISGKELFLLNFIKENYNGKIIENDRSVLNGKELDIYIPELNLAFEFNGLHWHNEQYKDKNYHKNKTESCSEKNIQLIHIWEDDFDYKHEILKSMILNKLNKTTNKIYARKCQIKEVTDNKLIKDFLNNNHIQGYIGSLIKLGLFYNNVLVSLMTFGKKRKFMNSSSNEGEYELLRFCNKLNTNVVGGASKLFKHFIKKYNPIEIITYADRSYSNGNLYKSLGFNFILKTEPNYYYVINNKRYHRFNFRKDVLVKEGYDSNKTEHEIMLNRKIYRIYNSGNLKYIFKNKNINI